MPFPYAPYLWVLMASAAITATLGAYAWRHRCAPGATPFALLMFVVTIWALASDLEMINTDLSAKIFWANLEYTCYAIAAPIIWFALTLQYLGQSAWLTRRRFIGLSSLPILTLALLWTNDYHGLVYRRAVLDTIGPSSILIKTAGPWFYLQCSASYLLLFIASALLLRELRRLSSPYRGQILVLVVGLLIPMIAVALHNRGLDLFPHYDISPALMSVSGLIVAWGLFYFRLFDLAPVARAAVIDGLDDGVIVLDVRQRIVDVNAAARSAIGGAAYQPIGLPVTEVFRRWPDAIDLCQTGALAHTQIALERDGQPPQVYDLRVSPLADQRGRSIGRVLTLRDITTQTRTAALLQQQQQALAVTHDRDRLARELHDGLAQDLAGLRLRMSVWHTLIETDPARLHREVDTVRDLLSDNIREVRRAIYALRPLALDELDFFSALRQFVTDFGRQTQLHIELCVRGTPERLPAIFEPIIFRIIQEALNNIGKHAQARDVHIDLDLQAHERLTLTIGDDGQGFDPATLAQAAAYGHLGLVQMHRRVRDLHGQFNLASQPGSGTQITIALPIGEGQRA